MKNWIFQVPNINFNTISYNHLSLDCATGTHHSGENMTGPSFPFSVVELDQKECLPRKKLNLVPLESLNCLL